MFITIKVEFIARKGFVATNQKGHIDVDTGSSRRRTLRCNEALRPNSEKSPFLT